jgi:hypothetical protein
LIEILSGAPLLHQYLFLIHFLLKIDRNTLWSLPPPPSTHSLSNYYSKLMKILTGAPLLALYVFLIQLLYKTDANPLRGIPLPHYNLSFNYIRKSLGFLASSHGSSLYVSRLDLYSKKSGCLGIL